MSLYTVFMSRGEGGVEINLQNSIWDVKSFLFKTFILQFLINICDFPFPVSDLTQE